MSISPEYILLMGGTGARQEVKNSGPDTPLTYTRFSQAALQYGFIQRTKCGEKRATRRERRCPWAHLGRR